jgi:cellobiose-specific phosphotransferase system component IIA
VEKVTMAIIKTKGQARQLAFLAIIFFIFKALGLGVI